VLEAALPSLLATLSAVGVGLSGSVQSSINNWGAQAQASLLEIKSLVDKYNSADASAKSGILVEIQTVLGVVTANLKAILPDIHVADAATQAKITAVVNLVADEFAALLNILPVVQGEIADHAEAKRLVAQLRTAGEFRSDYNRAAADFDSQYAI